MKINKNKICFLILLGISIALTCILAGLLLFTNYTLLQYVSLILAFAQGIYAVKVIHKYPLHQ